MTYLCHQVSKSYRVKSDHIASKKMENLKKIIKIKESMVNDYKEIITKIKSNFPETTDFIDEEIMLMDAKYIHLDQVKDVFYFFWSFYEF